MEQLFLMPRKPEPKKEPLSKKLRERDAKPNSALTLSLCTNGSPSRFGSTRACDGIQYLRFPAALSRRTIPVRVFFGIFFQVALFRIPPT